MTGSQTFEWVRAKQENCSRPDSIVTRTPVGRHTDSCGLSSLRDLPFRRLASSHTGHACGRRPAQEAIDVYWQLSRGSGGLGLHALSRRKDAER